MPGLPAGNFASCTYKLDLNARRLLLLLVLYAAPLAGLQAHQGLFSQLIMLQVLQNSNLSRALAHLVMLQIASQVLQKT